MAAYASGYLLFLRDRTLMAQPFDAGRLEIRGDSVPIAEQVTMNLGTGRAVFSVSENGTLVYESGEASGGRPLAPATQKSSVEFGVQMLAFSGRSPRSHWKSLHVP